jgi:hypothetical protein
MFGSVFLLVLWASLVGSLTNWYLLGIGGIGMVQNMLVAFWRRTPNAMGMHLKYKECFMEKKVMDTLKEVEKAYPEIGWNMTSIFFPNGLRSKEEEEWKAIRQGKGGESGAKGQEDLSGHESREEGGLSNADIVPDANAACDGKN